MNYPSLPDLVVQAIQRRLAKIRRETWRQEFRDLKRELPSTGGFGLGETKEEAITQLREIRQQLFERDYAHLY